MSAQVVLFRLVHGIIASAFLLAIGYVWLCALTRRRGRLLTCAVGSLTVEGLLVAANGGDCPLGGVGERVGDPTPLFELALSPRAARRAVPVLGGIAATGVALQYWRSGLLYGAKRAVPR